MVPPLAGASSDLSPQRFATELWSIVPKDWLVEFFFLRKPAPTPEKPKPKDETHWYFKSVGDVLSDYESVDTYLKLQNHKIWNCFYSVNPRFRKPRKAGRNEDVNSYTCLWADVDWHQGDEAGVRARIRELLKLLDEIGIYPSVVVESGYGMHFYWLLDKLYPVDPVTSEGLVRECCAGIQDFMQISDAINDPKRVLRWPGTANHRIKGQYPICTIVEASWRRYSLSEFEEYRIDPGLTLERISDDEEKRRIKEEMERIAGRAITPSKNPKVERYKQGVAEGERNIAAASMTGHYYGRGISEENVWLLLVEWNRKNQPPLDEGELRQTYESMTKKDRRKRAALQAANRAEAKEATEALAQTAKPQSESSDGTLTRFCVHQVPLSECQKCNPAAANPSLPAPKGRPKDEKAPGGKPWFDENGKWKPTGAVEEVLKQFKIITAPEGKDGLGSIVHIYQEGYFKGALGFLKKHIQEMLGSGSRIARINEVVDQIRIKTGTSYETLNPRGLELINVANGMLDWKTGKLFEHSPDYLSTYRIPVKYDPEAKSELLEKFLGEVFPADCIPLVEEFAGYLLIPDSSFQKCFIAVGSGGNGKTTFLNVLRGLLGPENTSSLSIQAIEEDRFAPSSLIGKLANINSDLSSKVLESTGNIKSVISGDTISTEEKNKARFEFTPITRLVFAANEFPKTTDRTEAWLRRLIFVPFPKRFDNQSTRVHDYHKVLLNSNGFLSAFLNRAIAGLRRLMSARAFSEPMSSREILETYKRDCSSALQFLHEHCDIHPEAGRLTRTELYETYKQWCFDSGHKVISSTNFCKTVRSLKVQETAYSGCRMWDGIRWKAGSPPETSTSQVKDFENAPKDENLDF